MKKLLMITTILLTGGFALPAAAQSHRGHYSSPSYVFVSGHLSCGTPIYSKRVRHGQRFYNQRLSSYELRKYLEQRRRIAAQREYERRNARLRYHYSHSRSNRSNSPCYSSRRR